MDLVSWLLLGSGLIVGCFAIGLIGGPPYVPTLTPQVKIALDMINLQKGQTLLELGCGDGKVLIAAAQRGWRAVGYEINPILALVAWLRTRRYGKQVTVRWANMWQEDKWDRRADGIFVFILPRHMPRLDAKINSWQTKPLRLVSFAFEMPGKKAVKRDKQGVFLYHYDK
jgi:hypothetical protein